MPPVAPMLAKPVDGIGARQVMIEDPSGNPVELFEPLRAEARLAPG